MIKIKFASALEGIEYPKPASKYIPEWYKKAERFIGGKPTPSFDDPDVGLATVKACVPFMDTYTSGYMIGLWEDVEVTIKNNKPIIKSKAIEIRPTLSLQNMSMGDGYYNIHIAWCNPFYIQTPDGYSVLVTHPLNHYDLPFITTSGIVDSDPIMTNGRVPFLLKEGFEGTIPKGTPIMQVIPFKRDDWKSEIDQSLIQESKEYLKKYSLEGHDVYKKNSWKRKTFD
jgi:hypothetical protein